jgi:homoserine dehydrogenase
MSAYPWRVFLNSHWMLHKMKTENIPLIVMGLGRVGREVIRQLMSCGETIRRLGGVSYSIIALSDSRAVVGSRDGLDENLLLKLLAHKESGLSLQDFPGTLPLASLSNFFDSGVLIADTSATAETTLYLRLALEIGSAVALANKLPLALSWQNSSAFFRNPKVRYESTVGAGLPVIAALRDLLVGGDEITAIEGCMSGTLGYLCSQLEQGKNFSESVLDAFQSGYTEPDPRQDLGGLDVARKALILSRTTGFNREMADIALESLYPGSQEELEVPDFLKALPELNAQFQERVEKANSEEKVLRYLARVTPQSISVGLTAVPKNSALGALQGTDNYFAFHTRRYNTSPLVIAGPGAGIPVTAAGVISDLNHLTLSR